MQRISINQPCHENWSAMTPSEQGAFCGKCQIDVIDFSGKTPEDVKQILEANVGKHLCGRFKKTQLDDLNATYADWDNQTAKTFQSKFLYACLIVFGMTLFSCNTPDEMILGEISTENFHLDSSQTITENTDSIHSENTNEEIKVQPNDEWRHVKGKVDINYYQNQNEEEMEYLKGDIAYIPDQKIEEKDTVTACETPARESISQYSQTFTPLQATDSVKTITSETNLITAEFSARLFPNPTGTHTNLEVEITQAGFFTIELISSNGQKVATIFSGELSSGISNYQIELSTYSTATYLVKVSSASQSEVYRILKIE
ncbi:MAG: T9SS type A sorting domain-containing protein [Crocinitomicaceae bacterium]|nr:T9SS type A sorting domain-containing protein [Crocinitomicaceae bacterium]